MPRLLFVVSALSAASPAFSHSGAHLHPHEAAAWAPAALVIATAWLLMGLLGLTRRVARGRR